jgi:MFS family permease
MGLTSFLSDAGHEMATAVLPAFLSAIAAPTYVLGVIEGFADALSSFVKLGAGWWSDRLGHRKAIATTGYVLTGGGIGLFAFAIGWPLVLLGRLVAWFGRGIRGPLRDAMLAESVAAKDRGKAFGFHRAGDTLGAVVGPLVGAVLIHVLQGSVVGDATAPFRTIFLLTLIPGLGAAVAFAALVRETRRPPQNVKLWASIQALPKDFRRYLIGVGVFGAGDFSHTLLILAATQLLTPEYGVIEAAQIGALLYALRNALYAAASYPVGALSDHWERRGLLILGYILGGLTMAGFAADFAAGSSSVLLLGLLFSLSGVFIATQDALEGAMTADLVPEEAIRGTAYGMLGVVNGVGDFLSSALVGVLWVFSPSIGFAYAAFMMLLGAILLERVR